MTRTITVKVADAKTGKMKPREVEARVYGHVAVHESTLDDDTHTISHLPTGLGIAYKLSETDAVNVAKRIRRLDWQFTDRKEIAESAFKKLQAAVKRSIARTEAQSL